MPNFCPHIRNRAPEKENALPCGVVAIDGKGLGALEHDAEGTAQKAHRSHDGSPYWLTRALRAVLTSAQGKPCLDQVPVDGKTNEMAAFGTFFADLMRVYGAGHLFEVVTVDAGMVSRANADRVDAADKGGEVLRLLAFPATTSATTSAT